MALANAVDTLNEGQMEGLLQIVQERVSLDNPSAAAANGGEVELDIESMDTATLRELQMYISKCTGQPLPQAARAYFQSKPAASSSAAASKPVAPPAPPAPPAVGGASVAEKNLARLEAQAAAAAGLAMPAAPSAPVPLELHGSGLIEGLGDDDEEEDGDVPPPPPM